MNKQYTLLLLLASILFSTCTPDDGGIPSYLQIDEYLVTTTALQGSASSKVQDVTVYAAGNLIGVFNLPATVPILETGLTDIVIDPGIRENGVSLLPRVYPFYTRFETSIELVEGETKTIIPTGSYAPNVEFVFIEDFEGSNLFTEDRDEDFGTKITPSLTEALEGLSGRIELTVDNPVIEVASNFGYTNLPTDGSKDVFLELDYKNDIEFAIGVIGRDEFGFEEGYYTHVLNPKGDWNKVYLNLTEVLFNSKLEYYQIAFYTQLPDNLDNARVLIDNVKLLHFE